MGRPHFTLALTLLAGAFAGCGDSGPAVYPVTGTVTLDGQPLADGRIAFRDTEGQIPSAGGAIVDGKFSFKSQPGTMRVSINARRDVPGEFVSPAPGEKVQVTEEMIPEEYNTRSEVTKEVVADDNEFHFDLASKPQE